MKPDEAATVIQKTWRGYQTRKLLKDYILEEEPKLIEMLESYHQSYHQSYNQSY